MLFKTFEPMERTLNMLLYQGILVTKLSQGLTVLIQVTPVTNLPDVNE